MTRDQTTDDAPLAPGLYLVATPIGNLEDITLRALRVLRSADRIACEDTRQTAKLLNHFGISTPTVSYHLHNETGRAEELLDQLKTGARIALVSDAGTPAIADPGAELVARAIAAGITVYPIPGASAPLTALVASGLSTERFTFHGFLPSKSGQRRTVLEQLRAELSAGNTNEPAAATHIFYETPHRILEALEDIAATFGAAHRVVLARELTKLHEEFLRGTVSEVLATLQKRPVIRGEIVLLLDGTPTTATSAQPTQQSLGHEVATLIRAGLTEKDALKQVARSRGLGKSEAYREWQRTKR
jgi:16S rRNA (cytidine1402-2'-O)-methyltransferase